MLAIGFSYFLDPHLMPIALSLSLIHGPLGSVLYVYSVKGKYIGINPLAPS